MRRTDRRDFISDLLAFVEEKLAEAKANASCQRAAVSEASGAIGPMCDRLLEDENDGLWASFVLVLGNKIERGHCGEWWVELAGLPGQEFAKAADEFYDQIGVLRDVLAASAGTDASQATGAGADQVARAFTEK